VQVGVVLSILVVLLLVPLACVAGLCAGGHAGLDARTFERPRHRMIDGTPRASDLPR